MPPGSCLPDVPFRAGPEIILPGFEWQMPQGGIDPGEDIVAAAKRELAEETAITSVSLLSVTEEWWRYDFPPCMTARPAQALRLSRAGAALGRATLRGRGRGGRRARPPVRREQAEFTAWDWSPLADCLELVTPCSTPDLSEGRGGLRALRGGIALSGAAEARLEPPTRLWGAVAGFSRKSRLQSVLSLADNSPKFSRPWRWTRPTATSCRRPCRLALQPGRWSGPVRAARHGGRRLGTPALRTAAEI